MEKYLKLEVHLSTGGTPPQPCEVERRQGKGTTPTTYHFHVRGPNLTSSAMWLQEARILSPPRNAICVGHHGSANVWVTGKDYENLLSWALMWAVVGAQP